MVIGAAFLLVIPQLPNALNNLNYLIRNIRIPGISTISPLTSNEIEQIQKYVSTGERNLTANTDEGNSKPNRQIFRDAKDRGIREISQGNYTGAIEILSNTRRQSTPESYKNAPETLIYLNNAKLGTKQAYTIAFAAPLGQIDAYGLATLRGVALAQQEINTNGGISDNRGTNSSLKVVLVDDQNRSNIKLAQFLSRSVIDISDRNKDLRIVGLIGHQTSDLTLKLGETYQNAGLPVVSSSSTSKDLFGKFRYVHLVAPSTRQLAEKLASEVQNQNYKKVIVFYDVDEEYSRSFGTESCTALKPLCTQPLSGAENS